MNENQGELSDSFSESNILNTLEVLPDRYQYQKTLGNKAGRTTILALDQQIGTQVVVKLLTFGDEFQWEDLRLFEREMATLRSLNHPAIPQYLDSFEAETNQGKSIALVQSYIPAKSLEEYLQEGRQFVEAEVRELLNALLDILVYLHDRHPPVIHRDIKPSNILLGDRSGHSIGQVYLVDFGSVQTLATRAGQTMTVVGTYGYMPPEQFGGSAVPASDIYSLGCTALRLITDSHPGDLPQRDLQIQFAQFTDLSSSFTAWLQKATHPSLDKRFSQAAIAKEILNQSPALNMPPLALSSGKVLTKKQRNWDILWRSTFMGTLAGGFYGTLLGTGRFFGYYYGNNSGLEIMRIVATEVIVGFSLGLINGVMSAIASNSLSTKDKYYSHRFGLIVSGGVLVSYPLVNFVLLTLAYFLFAFPYDSIPYDSILSPVINSRTSFIYTVIPILSFVPPMGLVSYFGARWYQKQLMSFSPNLSIDTRLLFWNFILRSAMGTLVGVLAGVTTNYMAFKFILGAGSESMVFLLSLINGVTAGVATLSSSNHVKNYPLKSGLIGAAVSFLSAASIIIIDGYRNSNITIPILFIALIMGLISSSNARRYQKQIEE